MYEIKKKCQINYYFSIGLRYLHPTPLYVILLYIIVVEDFLHLQESIIIDMVQKQKNNIIIIIPSYFLVLFCNCIHICYS